MNSLSDPSAVDAIVASRQASRQTSARVGQDDTGYAGAGYGAYHYRFAESPLRHPWRGGVHGVGGFEIARPDSHAAFDAEVRLHVVNAPGQRPVGASKILKLDLALGLKWRF